MGDDTGARLFRVTNCKHCPNIKVLRGPGGDSSDYLCTATAATSGQRHAEVGRLVAGYVESSREAPQDGLFPSFCPLEQAKKKRVSTDAVGWHDLEHDFIHVAGCQACEERSKARERQPAPKKSFRKKQENCACNADSPSVACEAIGYWHAGDPISRALDIKEGREIGIRDTFT